MAIEWGDLVRIGTGQKTAHKRLAIALGVLASTGILTLLILGHAGAIVEVAGHIDWRQVWVALFCSAASYLMIGMALRQILILLGHHLSFTVLFGIAFVSTTANYFVSSAGISGFALKAHLLRQRGVPYGSTVTASVLSTALIYFVLGAIIAQGTVYLALRMRGTLIPILEGVFGLLLLAATSAPFLIFFLNRTLRNRVTRALFHQVNRLVYYFSQREIPREDFYRFERQLNEGLEKIRLEGGKLTRAIGFTCLDWAFTMMSLYFCFRAVGLSLSVGHLITGFAVGQAATLIPILPGGLGAMEGSMAGVYQKLGFRFEDAMVAVLMYRMLYYVVPGICSIFMLWGLKMSEPALIEETISDTLPEELKLISEDLEKKLRYQTPPD